MVHVAKFDSVGDWEAVFIDGEPVEQNHIGRTSVLDHLEEGDTIESIREERVNLPEGYRSYPSMEEMDEYDDFDFTMEH